MAEYCRQHYNLATGGGLTKADGAQKVLRYAKGGRVSTGKNVKRGDKFTSITQAQKHIAKGFKLAK